MFFNESDRRLRLVWRIVIFGLVFLFLMLLGTALASFLYANKDLEFFTFLITSLLPLIAISLTTLFSGRFLDHRPFRDFGFRIDGSWWIDLMFGLVLGAFLMTLIFMVEVLLGWLQIVIKPEVTDPLNAVHLLESLILFLCVGFYEELFARGYLLHNFAEGFRFSWIGSRRAVLTAYILSSFIFGLLHLTNPHASIISTLFLCLAGLFLGLGFILTGQLAIPIGLHITWNFFQGSVYGFRVSGTYSPGSLLFINQGGPDLWTGGSFGPEGGLLGVFAFLIGIIAILAWVRVRRKRAEIQTSLAEYQPK